MQRVILNSYNNYKGLLSFAIHIRAIYFKTYLFKE